MSGRQADHQRLPAPEPRALTIADLLWMAGGCALLFALWSSLNHTRMGLDLHLLLLTVPLVVALVIVARQARYRRRLHPAEFMTFFVTVVFSATALPSVDECLYYLHRRGIVRLPLDWTTWRLILAIQVTIGWLVILMMVNWIRAAWMRTFILLVGFTGFCWGPLLVFLRHFDFLAWFTTIDPPWSVGDAMLVFFQDRVRQTPLYFWGVLAVALNLCSLRRGRQGWKWTCWFSFFLSLTMVVLYVISAVFQNLRLTGPWRIQWVLEPVYTGLLAFAGYKVASAFVRRWESNHSEQDFIDEAVA